MKEFEESESNNFIVKAWQGQITPWKIFLIAFFVRILAGAIKVIPVIGFVLSLPLTIWSIVSVWRSAKPERTTLWWIYQIWIILSIVDYGIKIGEDFYRLLNPF